MKHQFTEPVRDKMLEDLPGHIEEQMKKARRGGTGRKRRRHEEPGRRLSRKAVPASPAEELYAAVKNAALLAERDWTEAEREVIRRKYFSLRELVNATDEYGSPVNPAHGREGAVPKISSLVAYSAVYDSVMAEIQEAESRTSSREPGAPGSDTA